MRSITRRESPAEGVARAQHRIEISGSSSSTSKQAVSEQEASSALLSQESLAKEKIALFRRLFRGREDVYAVPWESKDGRSGYSPAHHRCLSLADGRHVLLSGTGQPPLPRTSALGRGEPKAGWDSINRSRQTKSHYNLQWSSIIELQEDPLMRLERSSGGGEFL